jgi:hypothetical protein
MNYPAEKQPEASEGETPGKSRKTPFSSVIGGWSSAARKVPGNRPGGMATFLANRELLVLTERV